MTSSMADIPFVVHNIKDITIGSDSWNLKVKVLRLWSLPDAYNLADFACLEMIFIDGEGTRIEASLPTYLMKSYNIDIVEERLYRFSTFSVVPNTGPYKATPHKYKLVFVKETKISLAEPFFIPVSTLNVKTAEELLSKGDE
ncbi:Nucleic acid-binding, OB-fold [Sesbania bispinosa]|nr:Nucleic acid-binding, OB-fold [Sesbania bispinosa]